MRKLIAGVLVTIVLLTCCVSFVSANQLPMIPQKELSEFSDSEKTPLKFLYLAGALATPGTPSYNEDILFMEKMAEYGEGLISVNRQLTSAIYSSASEYVQAIQLNDAQMLAITDMEIDAVIGGMGWAWLPYMITDYETADEHYMNGFIHQGIVERMAEAGIAKIANRENDFRTFAANVEVKSLADMKGVKIRTPEIREVVTFWSDAGALPVSITSSEVLTAYTQGTVDAVDNAAMNLFYMSILQNCKYIIPSNHVYSGASWISNLDWWNNLTEWQRAVISKACTEAGLLQITEMRDWTTKLTTDEGLASMGLPCKVCPVTEVLDSEMKEISHQLWEKYSDSYDAEMMEKVFEVFGGM